MSDTTEDQLNKNGDTAKIVMIYSVVGVLCALIIGVSMWLGKRSKASAEADIRRGENVVDGRVMSLEESIGLHDIIKLEKDFTATNQDGESVSLQSLEGKVWVFAQFYGSCPECNKVNFTILSDMYAKYKNDPNFQIVAVSVMQEADGVSAMKSMAETLQADTSNWWFLSADVNEVNDFCSENMLYARFEKNTNKEESGMQGAIFHDMGISVFNNEMIMKAKVDVFSVQQSGNTKGTELKKKQLDLEIADALKKA